jgi:hypothetical protein
MAPVVAGFVIALPDSFLSVWKIIILAQRGRA